MKKIIFIICVLSVSRIAAAQNGVALVGIKIGFTQSSVYGADVMDSLSKAGSSASIPGFHVGVSANSMISKHFWLKHDLLLNQKGATAKLYDQNNQLYQSKFRLTYIDAYPISPTFHFKGIQLFAGPYIGMLVNSYLEKKDQAGNLYKDHSIFGTPKALVNTMQKIDGGYVVGVEYEFPTGFNLGLRYVKGFVHLFENTLNQDHQTQIFNESLNFSMGYTFGRRKSAY